MQVPRRLREREKEPADPLYAKEIAFIIKNVNPLKIPRYNRVEEKINKAGVSVKYYRKFVIYYLRKQQADPM